MSSRYSFSISDGVGIGTNSQEIDYSNIVLKQEEVDIEPDDYFENHGSPFNNTSVFVKVENGSLDLMPTPREHLLSPTTSLIEISDDEEEKNKDDRNIQLHQCQSKPLNTSIEISDDDDKDYDKDDKKDEDKVDNIQDKTINRGNKTPNINRCHKTPLQLSGLISLVPELADFLYGDENIGNSEPEETTLINEKTSNSKLNNTSKNVEESNAQFYGNNSGSSVTQVECLKNHLESESSVSESLEDLEASNITLTNQANEEKNYTPTNGTGTSATKPGLFTKRPRHRNGHFKRKEDLTKKRFKSKSNIKKYKQTQIASNNTRAIENTEANNDSFVKNSNRTSSRSGSTSSEQKTSLNFEEYCDICNYRTPKRANFMKHLKTTRHVLLLSCVENVGNGSSLGIPQNSSGFKIKQENEHNKIINSNHNTTRKSNSKIMPPECHIAVQEDSNVIEEDDKSLIPEDYSIKYKLVNLDGVTIFQCKICDYLSKQHLKMEKHIKIHTSTNKLNECEKKLSISDRTLIFNKYKASCSKNEINHGQNSFSPNTKVDNQNVLHGSNKQTTHDVKLSTNTTPSRSSQSKKSLNCDSCEYQTKYSNHLKRHLQKVHRCKKLYTCEICAASFSIANKYKIHKSYHFIKNSKKLNGSYSSPISKESFPVVKYLNDHENEFGENSKIIKNGNGYVKKEESQCIAQNLDYYLDLLLRNKKLFKCNICTAMFIDSDRFEDHKTFHSKIMILQNSKRFSCDFCDYKSNHLYLIKNHILKSHKNLSDYKCQICKTRIKNFKIFLRHKKGHLGNVVFNQKKIQHLTTNQFEHNKTKNININDYSSIITDNDVKKQNSNNVNVLKRINYATGGNASSVYKKQKITSMKSSMGSYLQIDKCKAAEAKTSKSAANCLKVEQNSFVCDICNVGFHSQALLENHKHYHLTNSEQMPEMSSGGRKQVYCAICLHKFHYNYMLRRHMWKHLRLYRCNMCKFTSNNRSLFTQHKKTHLNSSSQIEDVTDERNECRENLECKSCKIKFNKPDEFSKHVRIHLPVVTTPISLAPVQNKTALAKQKKTHYKCNICNKYYFNKDYLEYHKMTTHN